MKKKKTVWHLINDLASFCPNIKLLFDFPWFLTLYPNMCALLIQLSNNCLTFVISFALPYFRYWATHFFMIANNSELIFMFLFLTSFTVMQPIFYNRSRILQLLITSSATSLLWIVTYYLLHVLVLQQSFNIHSYPFTIHS